MCEEVFNGRRGVGWRGPTRSGGLGGLFGLGLMVVLVTPHPGHAAEWILRAGLTRERPMTTGSLGYGNHGAYDGSNGEALDRRDRRHANWDQAPGLVVELTREASAAWTAPRPVPFTLAAEPYTRLTLVDTEFNETQRDWWYLTQTIGGRAVMAFRGLPWLAVHAGIGVGGGTWPARRWGCGKPSTGSNWGPCAAAGHASSWREGAGSSSFT